MEISSNTAGARRKKEPTYADQHWAGLIQKMTTGDHAALAEFYDQSNRLVFGLVIRIVNDRSAAEEITLDACHQAWRQTLFRDSELF